MIAFVSFSVSLLLSIQHNTGAVLLGSASWSHMAQIDGKPHVSSARSNLGLHINSRSQPRLSACLVCRGGTISTSSPIEQPSQTHDSKGVMMANILYSIFVQAPIRLIICLLNLPIHIIVFVLSRIISRTLRTRPVREAVAECIITGVRAVCEDPALDQYLDAATATINADVVEDARAMGRMVPRLVGGFLRGLMTGPFSISKRTKSDNASLS